MIKEFRGQFRFLSNFYPADVELDGEIYPTVEHAYQAAKTLEVWVRAIIRIAPTAGDAKRAGRQIPILRPDWGDARLDVMRDLVQQKFTKHPHLAELLIATKNQALCEGNTWGDTFWGEYKGMGFNHLGRILMDVRENLRGKKQCPFVFSQYVRQYNGELSWEKAHCEDWMPEEYDICDLCTLRKWGLSAYGHYDSCDCNCMGTEYYDKEAVIKALRKAWEAGIEEGWDRGQKSMLEAGYKLD